MKRNLTTLWSNNSSDVICSPTQAVHRLTRQVSQCICTKVVSHRSQYTASWALLRGSILVLLQGGMLKILIDINRYKKQCIYSIKLVSRFLSGKLEFFLAFSSIRENIKMNDFLSLSNMWDQKGLTKDWYSLRQTYYFYFRDSNFFP